MNVLKIIVGICILLYLKSLKNKKNTKQKFFILIFLAIFATIFLNSENIEQVIESIKKIFTSKAVWLIVIVVMYPLYLNIFIKLRNKSYEIYQDDDTDILKRTIDFRYNPSIIGYLSNHELGLKELAADILNLYAKKIVKIEKSKSGTTMFYLGEKYEEYKKSLSLSDEYIIEYITNNEKFDFIRWKKEVKQEYEQLELSKNRIFGDPIVLIVTIFLITVIANILFDDINKIVGCYALFILLYCIRFLNVKNKEIILTNEGKQILKDSMKLKKFMEEYTLLRERTVEEICIYESYIPYAIALGVNKKYEGTMFEIFGTDLFNIIEDINILEQYNDIEY